jgi:site-specific DNA recombinase
MLKTIVANGTVPKQALLPSVSRFAAIYARVSTEEQRDNQTIKTQTEAAKRWVEFQKLVEHPMDIAELYLDDGVSGTIALAERPAGKRLLADAALEKFALVLVYKIDRLGRDPRDILNVVHQLDQLGVAVKSLTEEFDLSTPSGKFMFNIFAAAAGFARDSQLERMNAAKDHWAREGAWLGGVVPYGYRLVGQKKHSRLVVSEDPIPELTFSEAEVVRLIYRLLAEEYWPCRRIAEHLNALGIPPASTVPHGRWRYGRIQRIAVNPVYKGEHHYGRRTTRDREVIVRPVPAIVDAATWERARQRLHQNQLLATRNAKRQYLLRGLITCGRCGHAYTGTRGAAVRGAGHYAYYACNGRHGRDHGLPKCRNEFVPAADLEETVWQDILGFLHNPGPVLERLAAQLQSRQVQTQDLERERLTAALALSHKDAEKEQILDLYRRGMITIADLERQLEKIATEVADLKGRLSTVETRIQGQEAIAARLHDAQRLLITLRARLKEDFIWEERRDLVEALVLGIRIDSRERIEVTYAFDYGVVNGTSIPGRRLNRP